MECRYKCKCICRSSMGCIVFLSCVSEIVENKGRNVHRELLKWLILFFNVELEGKDLEIFVLILRGKYFSFSLWHVKRIN